MRQSSVRRTRERIIKARSILSTVGVTCHSKRSPLQVSSVAPQYAWAVPAKSGIRRKPRRFTLARSAASRDQMTYSGGTSKQNGSPSSTRICTRKAFGILHNTISASCPARRCASSSGSGIMCFSMPWECLWIFLWRDASCESERHVLHEREQTHDTCSLLIMR